MTSGPDGTRRSPVDLGNRAVAVLAVTLAVLVARVSMGPSPTDGAGLFELSGPTMGTTYSVKIDAELDREAGKQVRLAVQETLTRVDRLMSTYDATSEISRFNRRRDVAPIRVSQELFEVLTRAVAIGASSDGLFDVTVGPLVDAWGFGPGGDAQERIDPTTMDSLKARVGRSMLLLDSSARTVTKADPSVRIDVSAIAKGYGVDRVAESLEDMGFGRYLIEVGGELRAGSVKRDGTPWSIGIERPEPRVRRLHAIVHVSDQAIATSGDYRQIRDADGRQRTHLIDPQTGSAIPFVGVSVSVVDRSATTADAWATALSVAGYDHGYHLALREGIAALFVASEGDTVRSRATPAFRDRVTSVEEMPR